MNTKIIKIVNSNLELDFEVMKDKSVSLLFCGLSRNYRKVKKDEKQFYKLVECEYVNGKENKHRGLKQNDSSYAKSYKYLSHEIKKEKDRIEVIISTSNGLLKIDTHYVMYNLANAISTYNVVRNISNSNVTLLSLSSFYQLGLLKANLKNTYLYQANNSWHIEAQWAKFNFIDLGIYNGNEFTSMSRYSINNTGSWSTKEHLPMAVIEDKSKHNATLIQIENNGSWHIELGSFINQIYLFGSGPEFYDNQWKKILKPNDVFESVRATLSFGSDFEETIQEITKARRILRRPNKDDIDLPVIYNDYMHALWDTQTTELIKPLVDIASKVGCDEFCMDAGWFAKGSDWWPILGKWEEYEENFPNGGLKALCDYIRFKGMKVGLWFEIEAVGVNSPILSKLKDGWLFKMDNQNVLNNDRYQLNFANPEVYEYALKVVDEAINRYKLDYIKIDYNSDAGVGNDYDADSLGDGLLKHNRAYIKWLNEVMDKHPNLTIENCGSGGCRMDYEMLKYCPIQSTSDQTNYRKYPYLSTNVLTACTPEQAAVWSYPLNDYEKIMPTDEVVIMNMCNAMLGRIHLASFINKLPESQLDLIREGLAYYRSISKMKIKSVPIYPKGTARFFDKEVTGGIMDESKGVLGVWNTSGKPRTIKVNISKYNIKSLKVGYPLLVKTNYKYDSNNSILEVSFDEDYGGRIFEFSK